MALTLFSSSHTVCYAYRSRERNRYDDRDRRRDRVAGDRSPRREEGRGVSDAFREAAPQRGAVENIKAIYGDREESKASRGIDSDAVRLGGSSWR